MNLKINLLERRFNSSFETKDGEPGIADLKNPDIMFNYSDNGLYLESDSVLEPGDQIYIGIQDSPYASANGVFEYHRSEIMWRKKLKDSYFEYGYGIRFCAELNKKSSKSTNLINRNDDLCH